MLSVNEKEYLYVEKYRPKNIDDLIVTEDLKKQMRQWVQDGEIPNLLLTSRTPGTGKTSLAHTILTELGADALFVNASLESNIDLLRSKIQGFASTASFDGRPKIIVLDEADYLNANSTQPALRGFIEEFSKNARFILTANYANKLIEPLRNRLITIDFDEMITKNKQEIVKQTFVRNKAILENEGIKYTKDDLVWLIKHFYPSNRLILSKIQQFVKDGVLIIDKEDIDTDSVINNTLQAILKNDFDAFKLNVEKIADPSTLFLTLYENITDFPQVKRPEIIVTIAKYQSWDSQVRDRLINAVACGVEVMQILQR